MAIYLKLLQGNASGGISTFANHAPPGVVYVPMKDYLDLNSAEIDVDRD